MIDYIEIDNKINVKEGDVVDALGYNCLILRILDIDKNPNESNICNDCQHKTFCLKTCKYFMSFPKDNKIICMVPDRKNIQIYEEITNKKIPKEKMENPIIPFITKFKNGQLLKYKNTFLRVNYYKGCGLRCDKCFFRNLENDECEASKHLMCEDLKGSKWAYEEISEIEKIILLGDEGNGNS